MKTIFVVPDRNGTSRCRTVLRFRIGPCNLGLPTSIIHAKSDARMTEFVPSGAIYAYIK